MRTKVLLVFALLAAGIFALHWFRYSYAVGGDSGMIVYRFDRLSGKVHQSIAGQPWEEYGGSAVNEWGDRRITSSAR